MSKKITIALDGYSSTGKSTLAKNLAKALGYGFIDTGAMYRSVALFALENGIITDDSINEKELVKALPKINISFEYDRDSELNTTFLNGRKVESEIRDLAVTKWVSKVSAIVAVRKHLVTMQQKMGAGKGVVLDGRDIGTVVFPNAELKIFMTADHDVRARRRFEELTQKGIKTTFEEVKKGLAERDHEDETREEGPLTKAKDAIILDNTYLTREEQFNKALSWAREAEEK